jgi:hypothetical protein
MLTFIVQNKSVVISQKTCQLHLGPLDFWSAGLKLSTEKIEPLECPAVCSVLEEKPNCMKFLSCVVVSFLSQLQIHASLILML